MIGLHSTKPGKTYGVTVFALVFIFTTICLYAFPSIPKEHLRLKSESRPDSILSKPISFNRKEHTTINVITNQPHDRPPVPIGNIEPSVERFTNEHSSEQNSESPRILAPPSSRPPQQRLARELLPSALLSRPLAHSQTTVPKLLHQSWSDDHLPQKFQQWSYTCRALHPDWEYVLWTDEDNLFLIKKYAPWFLDTYESLKLPIEKADAVRNVYMHVFGGVYVDLDVECLRPFDSLFVPTGEAMVVEGGQEDERGDRWKSNSDAGKKRTAYLARMGTDPTSRASIPNAWMASTPAHPFWLLPLEQIVSALSRPNDNSEDETAEAVTGPGALYDLLQEYSSTDGYNWGNRADKSLDLHYQQSSWGMNGLYKVGGGKVEQRVVVLQDWVIYPYSWLDDGEKVAGICSTWREEGKFDPEGCKKALGVGELSGAGDGDGRDGGKGKGSFAITYWSHSWGGEGHDQGRVELLNGGGGGGGDGGESAEGENKEGEGEEGKRGEEKSEEQINEEKKQEHALRSEQDPRLTEKSRDHSDS